MLLNATAPTRGIHTVTLGVTDVDGVPLGASDDVPIRSARSASVIWVILGIGVALLFGAIAVRLVRRVRAAAPRPADRRRAGGHAAPRRRARAECSPPAR